MSSTRFEELPLHYRHPTQEGTLILSFAIDAKDEIIKGYYFWAIQDDGGQANDHQVVKGLGRLNEIRNEFIGEGWRRWFPPKVQIAGKNRQDRRERAKIEEKNKKLKI